MGSIEHFDPLPSLDSPRFAYTSRILIWCVVSLVAGAALALCFMRTSVVVTCETTLVPTQDSVGVKGLVTGTVARVFVTDGAYVTAGQALLELDTSEALQASRSVEAQISSARERLQLLERSRDSRSKLHEREFALGKRSQQLAESARKQARKLSTAGLIDDETKRSAEWALVREKLAVSKAQLSGEAEIFTLGARERQVQENIRELERELELFRTRLSHSTIMAPRAGRVDQFMVRSVGQVVAAGEHLGWIVPTEEVMAVAKVPPSGIGFIKPGQRVRVKLHAYPFQEFGVASGEITRISSDALRGESGLRSAFYSARIRFTSQLSSPQGAPLPFLPGMAADSEIVLHDQRLLMALLRPLQALTDNIPVSDGTSKPRSSD